MENGKPVCEVTVYDGNGLTVLCVLHVPQGEVLTLETLRSLPALVRENALLERFDVIPSSDGYEKGEVVVTENCSVFTVWRSLVPDKRTYYLAGDLSHYKKDLWGRKRIPSLRFANGEGFNAFVLTVDLEKGDAFKVAAFLENGAWDDSAVLDAQNLSDSGRVFFTYGENPFGTGANVAVKESGRYILTVTTDCFSRANGKIDCVRTGDPEPTKPPKKRNGITNKK